MVNNHSHSFSPKISQEREQKKQSFEHFLQKMQKEPIIERIAHQKQLWCKLAQCIPHTCVHVSVHICFVVLWNENAKLAQTVAK